MALSENYKEKTRTKTNTNAEHPFPVKARDWIGSQSQKSRLLVSRLLPRSRTRLTQLVVVSKNSTDPEQYRTLAGPRSKLCAFPLQDDGLQRFCHCCYVPVTLAWHTLTGLRRCHGDQPTSYYRLTWIWATRKMGWTKGSTKVRGSNNEIISNSKQNKIKQTPH